MPLPAITPAKDFIDTLDRILDKGIVVDQPIRISLAGVLPPERVQGVSIERISVQTTGQRPVESEGLENLFAYWLRDLWSK